MFFRSESMATIVTSPEIHIAISGCTEHEFAMMTARMVPDIHSTIFDYSKPEWICLFEKSCQHRDFVSMAVIFYICKPNTSLTVNAWSIGLRSLFDKNWNGLTGCPSLSLLNYGKDQCRSDKTAILNTLTTSLIKIVNSLRPSDAIWWHRSGSTLAQVMACCLTAPSHYLNQCWLIISKV